MTVEEIDKRIADLTAQRDQLVAQAQLMIGKFMGKIELLEEMKAVPEKPPKARADE